jgi:hypothetical protein
MFSKITVNLIGRYHYGLYGSTTVRARTLAKARDDENNGFEAQKARMPALSSDPLDAELQRKS